jgi:hypothetical protein
MFERLLVCRQQQMDQSPAYRQSHASLSAEVLTLPAAADTDVDASPFVCHLDGRRSVISIDYSNVRRLRYEWISDTRVKFFDCSISSLQREANATMPSTQLTQTDFDFLRHDRAFHDGNVAT